MTDKKVITIEDRIPKLKEERRHKTNQRFITYITLFFLLILMVIYFKSPLSNVRQITIIGNHYISNHKIEQTSGISTSSHIWDIHIQNDENRLKKLPTVEKVTIERKFPSRVIISIKEYRRLAYLKRKQGFIPVLANGTFLPKLKQNELPINAPILIGWKQGSQLTHLAGQIGKLPNDIIAQISEIHYTPTIDDRGTTTLYMNDGNKVLVDINHFSENLKLYPEIVSRLKEGEKGIIDMTVGIHFTPYTQMQGGSNE